MQVDKKDDVIQSIYLIQNNDIKYGDSEFKISDNKFSFNF